MLLNVENLHVYYKEIPYLEDISFQIKEGEIFSIVGESGSGKTLTGLTLINLLPEYFSAEGKVLFLGKNILELNKSQIRHIRGKSISIIFQDPTTSLNPVMKIGKQIAEVLICHLKISKKEALQRTFQILDKLKISHTIHFYPHQLSGGMRQRVMIAMAIACNPELIIADEPTTALDVTVQEEILDLLFHLVKNEGKSLLLISHDINIVSEYADRVMIMYAGRILEQGKVVDIYENPLHPYTKALLRCIPSEAGEIKGIPGNIPSMKSLPFGCVFSPRCEEKREICSRKIPELKKVSEDHYVRCFFH